MDLRPYGIIYTLHPTKDSLYGFRYDMLSKGSYSSSADQFIISGVSYNVIEKLGEGTYGAGYRVRNASGEEFAIKRIKDKLNTHEELSDLMNEVLIQIILADGSKDQPDGPYVPRVYTVAYDSIKKEGFILCELMRNTFQNLVDVLSPADNDIVVPDALKQIAHMLKFFGNKYNFNHRDLKPDNIMYKKVGMKRVFVLIDFGFSCLTWNGLSIKGTTYFTPAATCFRRERDLAQLSYYILKYLKETVSAKLKTWLMNILQMEVGKHKCTLGDGCMIRHVKQVSGWVNTYNFLDRNNVKPSYTNATKFTRKIQKYIDNHPFNTPPVAILEPVPCSPGKIRDAAGHCVPAPLVAVPLMKVCPPGFVLNPRTNHCKKQKTSKNKAKQVESLVKKSCPPGKERNPATGRCITMKVPKVAPVVAPAAANAVTEPEIPVAPPAANAVTEPEIPVAPPAANAVTEPEIPVALPAAALPPPPDALLAVPPKPCPHEKIYNPKTRRCVKPTGWAGKHILKGDYNAAYNRVYKKK